MPAEGNQEEDKEYLRTFTDELKLIYDYSGLNFESALSLDCVTYKLLLVDAFIDKMRQTEQGQEYLENCWILRQTTPDRKTLRENLKGGGD